MRPWVAANPFGWLVDAPARRRCSTASSRLQWGDAVALVVAVALFVAGRWMFRRLSPYFEDFV